MLIDVVLTDAETTAEYVPYAKARLRELRKHWKGYMLSQVTRVDEVRIQLDVITADLGRVTLSGPGIPYMETGFLETHGWSGSSADDFRPSLVHVNDRIKSLADPAKLPNAKGYKITEGCESHGFGGCKPSTFVGTAANPNPNPAPGADAQFLSDPPQFCGDDLLRRKALMKAVRPSNFTGLMRLYAQALYGSDRVKDVMVDYSRSAQGELAVNTKTKDDAGNVVWIKMGYNVPTTGLLKIASGKYIMVEVYDDTVQWRHMTLPSTYNSLSKEHPREAEAYRLSQLTPSAYYYTAKGSGIEQALQGSSVLAYGWHFARNEAADPAKHRACLVSYVPTRIAARQMYVAANGTTDAYIFTTWRLEFTYDADKDELSYALKKAGSGTFMPFAGAQVWFPSSILDGKMEVLLPNSGFGGAYNAANTSATIYCFFDDDDNLVQIVGQTSDWRQVPRPPSTPWAAGPYGNTYFGINEIHLGQVSPVFHNYYGPVNYSGPWGFNDITLTSKYNPNGEDTFRVNQSMTGVEQYYNYPTPNGRPGDITVSISYVVGIDETGPRMDQLYVGTAYTDIATFCVIPLDDASAVILGKRRVKHSPFVIYGTSMGGSNQPYQIAYSPFLPPGYDIYVNRSVAYVYSEIPLVNLPWSGFGMVLTSVPTTWDNLNPNLLNPLKDTNDFFNSVKIDAYLLRSTTPVSIFLFTWTNPQDYAKQPPAESTLAYKSLFEPTLLYPFYNYRMSVKSSYFGEYRLDYCLPPESTPNTVYSDGWPNVGDAAYSHPWGADIPIGWA